MSDRHIPLQIEGDKVVSVGDASFTPGPWTYVDATKEARMRYAPKCVIQAGKKQVADFSWNDNSPFFPTREESQANARLIAAAPELLAELRDILDWAVTEKAPLRAQEIASIRAVIAKATGAA